MSKQRDMLCSLCEDHMLAYIESHKDELVQLNTPDKFLEWLQMGMGYEGEYTDTVRILHTCLSHTIYSLHQLYRVKK